MPGTSIEKIVQDVIALLPSQVLPPCPAKIPTHNTAVQALVR